jgi:hypothetical protein
MAKLRTCIDDLQIKQVERKRKIIILEKREADERKREKTLCDMIL